MDRELLIYLIEIYQETTRTNIFNKIFKRNNLILCNYILVLNCIVSHQTCTLLGVIAFENWFSCAFVRNY